MKNKKMNKKLKGFYYYIEDEKILEYMKLSTAEKLQWLEDIIEFTEKFSTVEDNKIREKFRKGEI